LPREISSGRSHLGRKRTLREGEKAIQAGVRKKSPSLGKKGNFGGGCAAFRKKRGSKKGKNAGESAWPRNARAFKGKKSEGRRGKCVPGWEKKIIQGLGGKKLLEKGASPRKLKGKKEGHLPISRTVPKKGVSKSEKN